MNKTEMHSLILTVREQIQEDLIVLMEEQFEVLIALKGLPDKEADYMEEIKDLACGIVVANMNSLVEAV